MIYLYIYLAVGPIVFLDIFSASNMGRFSFRGIFNFLNQDIRDPDVLLEFLVGIIAVPIMAVGMILAWPYILYFQYSVKRNIDVRQKAELLSLERENLIQRMSIVEIELIERVIDPLRAVPDLPFGHLNSAWGKV